jgi:large subunit ribosomal protein L22
MEARAQLKYLKGSPQKVRLVVDLIRGKKVDDAIQILRFTNKTVARDLEKLLRSAVANAENREAGADIDELVVSRIYVNEGPREKRIQPAPMGRAFRIQKRKSHVTVHLSDQVQAADKRAVSGERRAASPAPPAEKPKAAPRRRTPAPKAKTRGKAGRTGKRK